MEVSITYCNAWNYKPKAVSLAAGLKEAFGVDAELIAGGGGIFDVKVDGGLVYSKHQTGEFPDESRLIGELAEARRADGSG